MNILGIETSCDETAAAVVKDGTTILSNVVVSQIDIHKAYGGVVPEIAARSHIEAILPVIEKALKEARLTLQQIDKIAVTHTPGLAGSLLIGTLTARTLSILHKIPLHPTHHLKSHIYANWLKEDKERKRKEGEAGNFSERLISPVKKADCPNSKNLSERSELFFELDGKLPFLHTRANQGSKKLPASPSFPLLALVISGGHTQLILMKNHNNFEIIGSTKDDAIGEVFDKTAKILGLPYPGGPSIAKAAQKGNKEKYKLPHPKVEGLNFSFSGLKTAVLREVQKDLNLPISTPSHQLAAQLTPQQVADFAASFQFTAISILLEKLEAAIATHHPKSVLLAGGVSANQQLRQTFLKNIPIPTYFPQPNLSTDNAAMVAAAAYFAIKEGEKPTNPYNLNIFPRSPIHAKLSSCLQK